MLPLATAMSFGGRVLLEGEIQALSLVSRSPQKPIS